MKNDHDHAEKKAGFGRGITRRRFLKTMGSGAAIAAASDVLTARDFAKADVIKPEAIVRVNLFINGTSPQPRRRTPLVASLRPA